ncbi:uncharacterized protein LTHEOB_5931 [Lasiodiplodia theobromae]|uniref:uncharacterized protein n=1 Tax=Lasiodiplodia theobromae TaxID=45133 RepID=UPI0015C311AE|nr:uncharacterized protein LTHEOB_5931 [Lasiodiplodia theobromae]KAF4544922.1 hypothetical protein LTHEOB_5931 [Lasiodiplodia theobromae]
MPSTDSSPTLRDRHVSGDAMARPTGMKDPLAMTFPTSNVRAEPGPLSNQNGKRTSKAQRPGTQSPKLSSATASNGNPSTKHSLDTMTPEDIEAAHILVSMSKSGDAAATPNINVNDTDSGSSDWQREGAPMTDEEAAHALLSLANTDASFADIRKAVASRTVPEDGASTTNRNLDSIPTFFGQSLKKRQAADTSDTGEQPQTKKRRSTPTSPSAPALQHDTSSKHVSVNNLGTPEEVSTQGRARSLRKRKADKAAEVPTAPASPKRARFSQAHANPEQMLAPQHTASPKAKSVLKQVKSAPKSNDTPKPQGAPKTKDAPKSKDAPRSKNVPKSKSVPKQKSTGSSLPSLLVLGRKNKGVKESTAALLEKMRSDESTTSPEAAVTTELTRSGPTQSPSPSEPEPQQQHTEPVILTSTTTTATTAAASPAEKAVPIPRPRTKAPNLAIPPHIQAKHAELMALRRSGRYPPMPTADEMRDPKNPPEWVVGAKAHTVLLHPVPHYKLEKHLAEGQEQPPTELWFVNETTAPPGGVVLREAYVRRGKKRDVPIDFNSSEDIRDLNKWVTQKLCRWECARVRVDMYKRKYCDEEIEVLWEEARKWKKEWREETGKEDSELSRPEVAKEMAKRLNERFAGKMIRATYNGKQDKEEAVRPPREAPGVDSVLNRKRILKELGVPLSRKRSKKETEAEEKDVAGSDGEEEL